MPISRDYDILLQTKLEQRQRQKRKTAPKKTKLEKVNLLIQSSTQYNQQLLLFLAYSAVYSNSVIFSWKGENYSTI